VLELDLIRTDGGTQSRVELNQDTVADYAEAYRAGAQMPPVIIFFDGVDRWLADGFHRYFGARAAGLTQIYENVTPGTQRDAVLYSLKANATHGLKRTNADKRKAVETMLNDPEWSSWSDKKIAEVCGVGNQLVGDVRRAIFVNHKDEAREAAPVRVVERNGKSFTQAVGQIGRHRGTPKKGQKADLIRAELKAVGAKDRAETLEVMVANLQEQLEHALQFGKEVQGENESIAKILDSSDQLEAALAEAKKYRELASGLQARVNSMTTQIAELKRSVSAWKKKAGVAA